MGRTIRHFGRLPLGLLGAMALAALVETSVARFDLELCRPENMNWRWCRAAAKREAPGAEVLIFGTSMVQNGVLPRVIEKGTGRTAQSMAMYASPIPASYYLFRRAIEAGARPSAIVIDLPPNFLGSEMDSNALPWSDVLDVRDGFDLARTRRDLKFFAGLLTLKALPTYGYRGAIRDGVAASLQGKGASFRTENLAYLRNLSQNKGAIVPGKRPEYHGEISEFYRATYLTEPCRPVAIKAKYLLRIIALAGSRGIPVFWVMTPFLPEVQEGRDARGLDAPYDRFVRKVVDACPNVVVLDARHSGYKLGVFHDALHLDFEGANALSTEVARAINRGPSVESRWVALPPFRSRSLDVPVEIVLDSYRALSGLRR